MPEEWTGVLIGRMHNNEITFEELAKELGVTRGYVSMILNSKRKPPDARNRLERAANALIERKKAVNA